jgi:hypothetical protein
MGILYRHDEIDNPEITEDELFNIVNGVRTKKNVGESELDVNFMLCFIVFVI